MPIHEPQFIRNRYRNRKFPGRQADISWLHLSRKQDRHRRGRSITDAFRQFQTLNERKSHETRSALSKPITLSQELQTESRNANPTDAAEARVPPREPVRRETTIYHRLVAQKQSARLITGRPRSVTARDDQPPLAALRLGEPFSPE